MVSYAKMKTVTLGLLISFSIIGCSSNDYYADMSVNNRYAPSDSIVGLANNFIMHSAYNVPKQDRDQHESCVYFALDNANVGESCKWRGVNNDSNGTVRVSAIYPNGCHDLISTVWYRGKTKSWVDRACLQNNRWKFFTR